MGSTRNKEDDEEVRGLVASIHSLDAERERLRLQVERLTRERDEARQIARNATFELELWQNSGDREDDGLDVVDYNHAIAHWDADAQATCAETKLQRGGLGAAILRLRKSLYEVIREAGARNSLGLRCDAEDAPAGAPGKSGVSLGPEVQRRPASPEFVDALRQAGARDELVEAVAAEDKK